MRNRSLRHKQPASISVLIVAALAVAALAGACGSDDPIGPDPEEPVERHFTFDTNMEGWQGADLTFQGDTGHGGDADIGVVWLERAHDLSITAPPDGTVYVVIGVWGTWETARTYFVDDVKVRFDPVAG